MDALALPPAVATGVGSLPGDDPEGALDLVARWCPELPFWPQLPGRGPGADMVDEVLGGLGAGPDAAAALRGAPAEPPAAGRVGLDAFVAAAAAGRFPGALALKGQVAGPMTLASQLAPAGPEPELLAALADLVGRRAAWQAERLRGLGRPALVVVDEPCLAPGARAVGAVLAAVRAAGAAAGLHCCAAPPWGLVRDLAPDVVSFDAARDLAGLFADPDGRAVARAARVAWGLVPTRGPPVRAGAAFSRFVLGARRAGLDPAALARRALVTPSCGLGLATAGEAGATLATVRRLAALVGGLARSG